jgi:hypothetical protein
MVGNVVFRNGRRRRSDRLAIRFGSLEASAQGTLAVVAIVLIVALVVVFLRQAL